MDQKKKEIIERIGKLAAGRQYADVSGQICRKAIAKESGIEINIVRKTRSRDILLELGHNTDDKVDVTTKPK